MTIPNKSCEHGNHHEADAPPAVGYVHARLPTSGYYHSTLCAKHLANWSGPMCDCAVPGEWPWETNLPKLVRIIEESFGIERLLISRQSAMCDFPAILGALDKVSAAVGFEVKNTNYLVDIANRMNVVVAA